MGTRYKQRGDVLDHTAGSAINADDIVVIGDCVGIANVDIASGEEGGLSIEGVFTVPKTTGTAWSQGDSVDFDASAGEFHIGVSPAAGDVQNCGIAAEDAGSADATGLVKLTPGTGTGA